MDGRGFIDLVRSSTPSRRRLIQASAAGLAAAMTGYHSRRGAAAPVTGHPRLWLTAEDLPRLRAWAVDSNPLYRDGLAVIADEATAEMDAGRVPAADTGDTGWSPYFAESYAQLFAFLSLIDPDQAKRDDYAARARACLMAVVDEAAKGTAEGQRFRDPRFSISDRSRWTGETFPLTVDWIYPTLTSQDKATIRQVFLRWADENVRAETTTLNHPEPIGVVNDPILVSDRVSMRYAGNNYYEAHMRNLGLMAMALDPEDDPGGELGAYLGNATGAWLYVVDHLYRTDARGGLAPEGFEYSPHTLGYWAQFLWALHTAGQNDPETWGPQVVWDNPFWDAAIAGYLHSLSPAPATRSTARSTSLPGTAAASAISHPTSWRSSGRLASTPPRLARLPVWTPFAGSRPTCHPAARSTLRIG